MEQQYDLSKFRHRLWIAKFLEAASYGLLYFCLAYSNWFLFILDVILIIIINNIVHREYADYNFYVRFAFGKDFVYKVDNEDYAYLIFVNKLGDTNLALATALKKRTKDYYELLMKHKDLKDKYTYSMYIMSRIEKQAHKEEPDINEIREAIVEIEEVLAEDDRKS